MVPLALSEQAALVEWATHAILVVFTAEVASYLPGDIGILVPVDVVVEDAARVFELRIVSYVSHLRPR